MFLENERTAFKEKGVAAPMNEKRQYQRVETDWVVKMVAEKDKREYGHVRVINIGGGGVSFQCEEDLQPGDTFLMHLPFVSVYIYIIWCNTNRYGAMFLNPLGNELEIIYHNIYSKDHPAKKDVV